MPPALKNEDDLDLIGHEVYGEPPAPGEQEKRAREKNLRAIIKQLGRREQRRLRPAPLLDRIDEEEGL